MTKLAKLPRGRCPACRARLNTMIIHQPALFIHAGYGATERTTIRWCRACGWSIVAERTEVRP